MSKLNRSLSPAAFIALPPACACCAAAREPYWHGVCAYGLAVACGPTLHRVTVSAKAKI